MEQCSDDKQLAEYIYHLSPYLYPMYLAETDIIKSSHNSFELPFGSQVACGHVKRTVNLYMRYKYLESR